MQVAGLQVEDTSSIGCTSGALVNQAVFTEEAFVNDMILRDELSVYWEWGRTKEEKRSKAQDAPQHARDLKALKVKDPSHPRGVHFLKQV